MSTKESPSPPAPVQKKSWRRRALRLLMTLLFIYLGLFILLLFLERRLIFYPMTASQGWMPPPASIHAEDITLTISKGVKIHAWWCTPEGWSPEQGAMLYCHGNAGNLSHRGDRIRLFQKHLNVAVLIFDYPGYGKSEGKPDEKGCYESAEVAHQWLMQKGISEDRIILAGSSLGGGVAVELATHHRSRALVLISPFTSIPDMAAKQFPWLPARRFIRNRFENLDKITMCKDPVFIAHGTADSLVPYEMGEKLYAVANEPKRLLPLPGLDHNDAPDESFYTELRSFID